VLDAQAFMTLASLPSGAYHSPLDYFHTIYLKDSPRSRTYSCSSQCEVIHLLSNAHIFISRLSICLPKDSLANCCTCTFTFFGGPTATQDGLVLNSPSTKIGHNLRNQSQRIEMGINDILTSFKAPYGTYL